MTQRLHLNAVFVIICILSTIMILFIQQTNAKKLPVRILAAGFHPNSLASSSMMFDEEDSIQKLALNLKQLNSRHQITEEWALQRFGDQLESAGMRPGPGHGQDPIVHSYKPQQELLFSDEDELQINQLTDKRFTRGF
jgi:hypothetical protein